MHQSFTLEIAVEGWDIHDIDGVGGFMDLAEALAVAAEPRADALLGTREDTIYVDITSDISDRAEAIRIATKDVESVPGVKVLGLEQEE